MWKKYNFTYQSFEKYRQAAEGLWDDGKPEKWYYGVPFVLVWILVLALIVKAIWF